MAYGTQNYGAINYGTDEPISADVLFMLALEVQEENLWRMVIE